MDLDHERLDVYHLTLDFLVLVSEIIEGLPRGRSHLSDQFSRASLSIVLNLAEGAGKHSKPDKRRYYLTARGSATESAALLDVCCRLKWPSAARIESEPQPKQRTPDRDHSNVVAESLLVTGSETAGLPEQTVPRRPRPRSSARIAAIFAHFRSSSWSRTIDSPMEHTHHPMESHFRPSGHGHVYGRT